MWYFFQNNFTNHVYFFLFCSQNPLKDKIFHQYKSQRVVYNHVLHPSITKKIRDTKTRIVHVQLKVETLCLVTTNHLCWLRCIIGQHCTSGQTVSTLVVQIFSCSQLQIFWLWFSRIRAHLLSFLSQIYGRNVVLAWITFFFLTLLVKDLHMAQAPTYHHQTIFHFFFLAAFSIFLVAKPFRLLPFCYGKLVIHYISYQWCGGVRN